MSFACPSCGTDYSRKLAQLDTLPAKVRCHRCATVWQPTPPHVEAADPPPQPAAPSRRAAVATPAVATPAATKATRPPGRALAWGLWAVALLLLAGGIGAFGHAYRDRIPFLAEPLPVLAEVQPAWTEIDGTLRLTVAARAINEGGRDTAIDRVRVKFLSAQGAWIGETTVDVGRTPIASGGDAELAFTVERVPDGTMSLEFVLLAPTAPVR